MFDEDSLQLIVSLVYPKGGDDRKEERKTSFPENHRGLCRANINPWDCLCLRQGPLDCRSTALGRAGSLLSRPCLLPHVELLDTVERWTSITTDDYDCCGDDEYSN